MAYKQQKKRLETLQRVTPNWIDSKQVEAIYLYCDLLNLFTNQKYSVNHIIPLHNPKVCGLHNQFNVGRQKSTSNSLWDWWWMNADWVTTQKHR